MFQRSGWLITAAKQRREQKNIVLSSIEILSFALNTSENCRCALVSGSFSVALSSSALIELGYVSRVQKERNEIFKHKKLTEYARPELPPCSYYLFKLWDSRSCIILRDE